LFCIFLAGRAPACSA